MFHVPLQDAATHVHGDATVHVQLSDRKQQSHPGATKAAPVGHRSKAAGAGLTGTTTSTKAAVSTSPGAKARSAKVSAGGGKGQGRARSKQDKGMDSDEGGDDDVTEDQGADSDAEMGDVLHRQYSEEEDVPVRQAAGNKRGKGGAGAASGKGQAAAQRGGAGNAHKRSKTGGAATRGGVHQEAAATAKAVAVAGRRMPARAGRAVNMAVDVGGSSGDDE